MLLGLWLQMQFGEIISGEPKIDALKRGGGYKQKGNGSTIASLSSS